MSDPHGLKDVLMESGDNVVLNRNHNITGSSFNNILLALFTLNTQSTKKSTLPGGLASWKLLEETLCIMLSHIAKIEHILQRVFHLVLCDCFGQNAKSRGRLAEGAVSFLNHWTTNYDRFISQEDFHKMNQILENFISHLLHHDAASNGRCARIFSATFRDIISTCSRHLAFEDVRPYFDTVISGAWDQSSEKTSFLHGSIESIQQSKAIEMKNPNDSTPPVIAIFGITQDMLDHSDDDDYNMPICGPRALVMDTPIARIPTGFDMLQNSGNVKVWDFDVKEIARQWTLMDHALFIAIPLVNLQCCQWTEARHLSKAKEIRRFIDRFNAESCWVTQSLLAQESSKSRAALYMKFVFLASFLEEMNNFNGLMAILTSLQQGCITRLLETLSYVDEKTKQTLKRLQILMSGSMNYKKYRDNLMDMMNDQDLCMALWQIYCYILARQVCTRS